ncbi:hypothetical protein GOV12_04025 [Candidatus Pacearchaeota archaeon]|nr:hypothetical protein [Candidatus Pacearchaeota archaeon]
MTEYDFQPSARLIYADFKNQVDPTIFDKALPNSMPSFEFSHVTQPEELRQELETPQPKVGRKKPFIWLGGDIKHYQGLGDNLPLQGLKSFFLLTEKQSESNPAQYFEVIRPEDLSHQTHHWNYLTKALNCSRPSDRSISHGNALVGVIHNLKDRSPEALTETLENAYYLYIDNEINRINEKHRGSGSRTFHLAEISMLVASSFPSFSPTNMTYTMNQLRKHFPQSSVIDLGNNHFYFDVGIGSDRDREKFDYTPIAQGVFRQVKKEKPSP